MLLMLHAIRWDDYCDLLALPAGGLRHQATGLVWGRNPLVEWSPTDGPSNTLDRLADS